MSNSPGWSSGADPNSIWNSNSPNLNILRRYSLRSSSTAANNLSSSSISNNVGVLTNNNTSINSGNKSTCTWEPSSDNKYLIGYIVIHRQDLGIHDSGNVSSGFNICGGKPTHDGQYGAIVEHVVPGSLINLICKLKVDDEIVEWNGFNLRNKRNDEVCDIIESVKNANSLRLVAVRMINNNGNSNSTNNNGTSGSNKNTDITS